MRRSPIPLLAAVLAVVTALALLRAAQAITVGLPDSDAIDTNRELAHRFYDAVNKALRTGDAATVDALVTDDYAEPDQGIAEPGRAAFRQRLAALHATHPDLQLVVNDVLVRRDAIVARLDVRGHAEASFLGASLSGMPPPWGTIDLLRVEHGRIAERRSGGELAPHLRPLWTTQVDGPPVVVDLALTRLTVAPGATTPDLRNPGPALIAVESGELSVTVADLAAPNPETVLAARGQAGAVEPAHQTTTVGAGETIVLPVATPYTFRNDGSAPAVALGVALFAPVTSERRAPHLSASDATSVALLLHGLLPSAGSPGSLRGVAVRYLGGGPLYGLPMSSVNVGGGRVWLPPGASLPLASTAGTTLLAVEAGTGEVAITTGLAQTRHDRTARLVSHEAGKDPTFGQTATLAAEGMAFLPPDTAGTLRNVGTKPVQALVVRVGQSAPTSKH